jgi:glyoxylase-like metal-dependent hydrolase (beta-lactamase superfamily II)
MQTSNSGIHHTTVGDITVTALNDGITEATTDLLAGLPAGDAEALLRASFRKLPPRITISAFLLTIGGKHVLIDAGSGSAMGPGHGMVHAHLATLGIDPAAIGTVLVTHAHIDHVAGLIDAAGGARFPNAELVINKIETDFWLDAATAAAAPEAARDAFALAARSLAPYGNRTRTVRHGEAGLSGIVLHHLPGHTPGHSGWIVSSGSESMLIWGDVVHMPGIQFARPEAGLVFDTDVEQARASRARAFDMAATDRLRVAGMHHDFPTFGHVVRAGSAYAFIPEVWSPDAG